MRSALWVGLGFVGMVGTSALGARTAWPHLLPDVPLLLVAYMAMRRGALRAVTVALPLGYVVGRTALAPLGLHEAALVGVAIVVASVSGSVGGSGAAHFAAVAFVAQVFYHGVMVTLLWSLDRAVGFASWPAALLFPQAALSALLAPVAYAPLGWLFRRLSRGASRGPAWR